MKINKIKPAKRAYFTDKLSIDLLLLIRLVVAAILITIAHTFDMSAFISIVLLAAAAAAAGYDIIFEAVKSVSEKDYFSYNCLLIIVSFVAFIFSLGREAVLMLIFYQLGNAVLQLTDAIMTSSAKDYIQENDEISASILETILAQPDSTQLSYGKRSLPVYSVFTKAAIIVALVYAIILPFITDLSFSETFRRALVMIMVAAPMTAVASLPLCATFGISYSAAYGVYVKDAAVLEQLEETKTVIFDKTDVLSNGIPSIASISTQALDKDTFIKVAAHIVCLSEQRISASIMAAYKGKIDSDIVENFKELPGSGMEVEISGVKMYLGSRETLDARGVTVPDSSSDPSMTMYMVVSGRYAGKIVFADDISPYAKYVVSDLKNIGNVNSVLLTEDNRENTEALAKELEIDEFYCECDSFKKAEIVRACADDKAEGETLVFVSAENSEYHSAADIDAKIGYNCDVADMVMSKTGVFGLPVAYFAAKRTKQIARENLIFAYIIKAILFIMAFLGNCTLWFAILVDFVVSTGTMLNTSRITDPSLINIIKEKLK